MLNENLDYKNSSEESDRQSISSEESDYDNKANKDSDWEPGSQESHDSDWEIDSQEDEDSDDDYRSSPIKYYNLRRNPKPKEDPDYVYYDRPVVVKPAGRACYKGNTMTMFHGTG